MEHSVALAAAASAYNALREDRDSLLVQYEALLATSDIEARRHLATIADLERRLADALAQLGPEVLLSVDFRNETPGPVTAERWAGWFGADGGASDAYFRDRSVWVTPSTHGNCLRVPMPAALSPTFVIVTPLPRPVRDVTVNSEYAFAPDFPWGRSGKAGVGVGGTSTNASPPAGGKSPANGCSLRDTYYSRNRIGAYTYHDSQDKKYGDDEILPVTVQAGAPLKLSKRAMLNSPGAADGLLQVALDGETLIDKAYRWTDVAEFNRLMWAVFRGGGDSSYTVSRNSYVDFYRVEVTTPR